MESDLFDCYDEYGYCDLEIWHGYQNNISREDGVYLKDAFALRDKYKKEALLYGAKHEYEYVLYSVVLRDETLDIVTKVYYFTGTRVAYNDLAELYDKFSEDLIADFYFINGQEDMVLCREALAEEKSKRICPLTLKEANEFVKDNHRHHDSVTGCKFAIGLVKTVGGNDVLIGAAICGRPVSRYLDDGLTLEVNRLCVTEGGNCCSMLYGACARIAKEMGYKKIITYILESEPGTSLKASGYVLEDESCGGKRWTGKRKNVRSKQPPEEMKQRWAKSL